MTSRPILVKTSIAAGLFGLAAIAILPGSAGAGDNQVHELEVRILKLEQLFKEHKSQTAKRAAQANESFRKLAQLVFAKTPAQLSKQRKAWNEAAAMRALNSYGSAQTAYRQTKASGGSYAGSIAELAKAGLLSKALATGKRDGYSFKLGRSTAKGRDKLTWWASAAPIEPGESGARFFATNNSGAIWQSDKAIEPHPASGQMPPEAKPAH